MLDAPAAQAAMEPHREGWRSLGGRRAVAEIADSQTQINARSGDAGILQQETATHAEKVLYVANPIKHRSS